MWRTTNLLDGLLSSWRKAPLFAPDDGAGGGEGNGGEGDGEGSSGTSDQGRVTTLTSEVKEGQADGDGADGDGGDGGTAGDATDPRDAVPEDGKYEFVFDKDTYQLSDDAQAAYAETFAAAGLTQKQVDAVVAGHVSMLAGVSEAADAEFKEAKEGWLNEAKTDKELGADWNATVATATRAMKQFGDAALAGMLEETGLGDHPAFIRAFSRVGKALAEDRFLPGSDAGETVAPEKRWYGDTTPETKKG